MATEGEDQLAVKLAKMPDLGAMRTMMAADRTLMAWTRTSLSLLSFGYTIYKVLQEVQEVEKVLPGDTTPRHVGAMLTVAGTVALLMGTMEYWQTLRVLRHHHLFRFTRPSLIMSVLMSAAGVLLTIGILERFL